MWEREVTSSGLIRYSSNLPRRGDVRVRRLRARVGRRRRWDTHPEVYSPAPIINALIIFA